MARQVTRRSDGETNDEEPSSARSDRRPARCRSGRSLQADAQKSGGVLKVHHQDSPASMSIIEEATYSTVVPMMGVFNNLVMYKQDEPQNSMKSIVPDLATSWSWSEDGTELTFSFAKASNGTTASRSPRQTSNALTICCSARRRRSFASTRARPGSATSKRSPPTATARRRFICTGRNRHLSLCSPPAIRRSIHAMCRRATCAPTRSAPGPSNLSRSSQTKSIRVERNPDYWKTGRPYLDGIEYTIIPNRSTAILAFIAGKLDMTWPYIITVPLLKDIRSPSAAGDLRTEDDKRQHQSARQPRCGAVQQRGSAAGDGAGIGPQSIHRHPQRRKGEDRRRDAAAAGRNVGHAAGDSGTLPGYGPDVQKNRAEARKIMEKLGYGPDKRLPLKVSARNINSYRDPGGHCDRPAQGDLYRRRAR